MKIATGLLLVLVCFSSLASAGEMVDQLLATVNGDPVLASDVEDAARIECLLRGKKAGEISLDDFTEARERLIDRVLLRQQMSGASVPTAQQVEGRFAQVRAAFPEAKSDAGWKSVLAAYGVGEQRLRKSLEEQLQIMQFVDARMRPLVHVSRGEVESYYREKLLPELTRQAAAIEPLADVQSKIYEILLQEKIDAQLSDWLTRLRNQGGVQILPAEITSGGGSVPKALSYSAVIER